MDATIFWLCIFTLCVGLLIICFSVRKIIRELRHDHEWSPSGEPRPHWYMNFVIRQEIGMVFFMGMLVLIGFGFYFTMRNRHLQSSSLFWLLPSFCFSNAVYRIYTTISEEYERRKIGHLTGEALGRWRASFKFHRGMAIASFWIGLPLPVFLIGWNAVSNLSSNPMDVYFWLAGIFAGLSGFYWLGTYGLEFLLAYRRGGWAAVERTVTNARQPLPSRDVSHNGQ